MRRAFLGIDLGTSGVKVILVDQTGYTLTEATRTYPTSHPFPGAAETDPAQWWNATCVAVQDAVAPVGDIRIVGVGVDGQMHGLVLADEDGAALRPAMTWADTRASDQAERWRALPDRLRRLLGNPISPGMTGPMLAWLLDHEPDVVERAAVALLPKDWLRMQLTGRAATEPSDASATLLWNTPEDTWAIEVTSTLGLPDRLLPPVLESADPAGDLTDAAAAQLGIISPGAIPVATGAADTAAALLATALRAGQTLLTIGTGAQIVQPLPHPTLGAEPVTHLYRAAQPDQWYAMAAIQNGGLALNWARDVLHVSWNELYAAATTPPNADDPIFIPYLTGERTPLLDTRVRGAWVGLDLRHTRIDLLRAAVTGVCCAIRHALAKLPDPTPTQLLVAGGGTRHPAMRQMLTSILGLPLMPVRTINASATGAALLAAAAVGTPLHGAELACESAITPAATTQQFEAVYEVYLHAVEQARTLAAGRQDSAPGGNSTPTPGAVPLF